LTDAISWIILPDNQLIQVFPKLRAKLETQRGKEKRMKNALRIVSVLILALAISAGAFASKDTTGEEPLKIAFFVSDLTNVFHQGQAAVAVEYAKEVYGAEVYVFDGKSDGAVMLENIDQLVPQGIDMATLHIWDWEAARPAVLDAIDNGVTIASFFSPLGTMGIPTVRSDEPSISYGMGVEMAKQWVAAHPDKPVVMVQLGWPNHTEVASGRTDPFVQGVLSVAPNAVNLGCLDASAGGDATKQMVSDLVVQHPEVNLIYSEASNLTVGTMAALRQAGRGVMDNGVPLTEIVCSVDFDEVEWREIYDPSSSLKLSMGLPPIETGQARIDNLFAIRNGELPQFKQPEDTVFAKAYQMSYWTTEQAFAANWLNDQFGTDL